MCRLRGEEPVVYATSTFLLRRTAVLGLAFVLAAGLGACAQQPNEPDDGSVEPTDTVEPTGTPPANYVEGVRVYFTRDERIGASVHYRFAESDESPQELAVIETLAGPNETERGYGFTSAIPAGTRLLRVEVSPDGLNTVDLSGTFDDGRRRPATGTRRFLHGSIRRSSTRGCWRAGPRPGSRAAVSRPERDGPRGVRGPYSLEHGLR
jgi:hypothetical protein